MLTPRRYFCADTSEYHTIEGRISGAGLEEDWIAKLLP